MADEPNESTEPEFEPISATNPTGGRMIDLPIEEELKDSYLTYAMSVIVSLCCPMYAMGSSLRTPAFWWR